jgi:hypothetical protein
MIFNKDKFDNLPYSLDNQLMSCMINNAMIITPNKKIIIYECDGVSINASCIYHVRDKKEIYDKSNLGIQMKRCIQNLLSQGDIRKTLVFCYRYHDEIFETYFIDLDVSSLLLPLDKSGVNISNINYFTNYKSITS